MNERSYTTVQRSEPTITLIPTFTEDILQYIKSRCRHNVSEKEKKQRVPILDLALWYSQDQCGDIWTQVTKHFTRRQSRALLGSQVSVCED